MKVAYVPPSEFQRILGLEVDPPQRAAAFADACRINALSMITEAGSGHIGTSFSCMDLLCWLHLEELTEHDRYFSSKGHDAPALYSVLTALGRLEFDLVHRLRRLGGLPGHPDVLSTPQVHTNTGSLGMGISKARGFVLADRMAGRPGRVFVLTGDGELQEGQFWESLQPTANKALHEITVIVDHNKLQSDTWVSEVSDLGDLERKVAAFGWAVDRCDGHDLAAVGSALESLTANAADRPQLLIADTVKGKGVSFMEPGELPRAGDSLYAFHSGAPAPDEYQRGLAELEARLNGRLGELGAPAVKLAIEALATRPSPPERPQRLIGAYATALATLAERAPQLVVLDGDLSLDTGLGPFRARFPERFIECGIAEQDMVSQAGAMALTGLLPVVHSFACFLTPRANEQIYNNASEGTKVIYVGSLAGIVPGGPGHSHQSVRDAAIMGCIPGMSLIEPFCEAQAAQALEWAVHEALGPVYIRLVSVPWNLGFDPPTEARLEPGRGTLLRDGSDAMFVATGPIMVSQAWAAADTLFLEGISAGVVALPWLRDIDGGWLAEVADGALIVTIDNHVLTGGQGEAVIAALSEAVPQYTGHTHRLGVTTVPACGRNDEVLDAHALDAAAIAGAVAARLRVTTA